jgi:hypothetical protein
MTAKAQPGSPIPADGTTSPETTKEELQQRVDTARESISQTVGEIRDTVEGQYESVKATVSGILDWREGFRREPIVWSLGALSTGFALGYTLGVGEKRSRRAGSSPALAAFTEGLIDQIRAASGSLPLATLDPQMRALFGFDLSDLLAEIGAMGKPSRRTAPAKRKRRLGRQDVKKRRA